MADMSPEELFSKTVVVAAKLPGVRVDRELYLRSAFSRECASDQLERAVRMSPVEARISAAAIERAARAAIKLETTKATTFSTISGIPGGLALIGTIPLDTAQYFAHMIRVSQKLAYLYGWPDLFDDDSDMDDATRNVLVLFLGVMLGASAANAGITKVSTMLAGQTAKKLPQKALTKGVVYPIVKKVAQQLGVKMTKDVFARGVSKAIPLVGAIASGGLTLATFLPMANRLHRHLAADAANLAADPSKAEPLVS